jgi:hypothetical protein
MKYFLATMDGILTANKKNVDLLKMVVKAQPQGKTIVDHLIKILYLNDKDILVYDATAKILAVLLSELEDKEWRESKDKFLVLVMSLWEKRTSSHEARVTDCVTYHCLMFLLRDGALAV